MSIVLQDNVLFSGTILDNLRLVQPDATDQKLIRLLKTWEWMRYCNNCRKAISPSGALGKILVMDKGNLFA